MLIFLLIQAKKLEANIELTQRETEETTEVEIELKRRLSQLTDHLIQKQAQVCLSNRITQEEKNFNVVFGWAIQNLQNSIS